jgi:hypothetical protein
LGKENERRNGKDKATAKAKDEDEANSEDKAKAKTKTKCGGSSPFDFAQGSVRVQNDTVFGGWE